MKKKGFTLIELLAVIVILAVIALIATPLVLNTIEKAREGAAVASAYTYAEEVERYIILSELDTTLPKLQSGVEYQLSSKKFEVASVADPATTYINDLVSIKGDKPTEGYVILDSEYRIQKMEMIIKSYPVTCENDECKITGSKVEVEEEEEPKVLYTENILNGTDPVLSGGLIPVTIADDGTVKKADIYSKWYSYEEKKWANAVILTDTGKVENDGTIKEESIESYFVWIPRYKYQLFDLGNYTTYTEGKPSKSSAKEIQIVFENKDTPVSNGNEVGQYLSHPAFQAFDTNGIWVGKFETTGSIDNITVKPGITSLRSQNIKTMFELAYNYNRNSDSHMMKNTEWGAVAYLSHSKYGINNEININNNSDYLTGYSAKEGTDQSDYPGTYGNDSSVTLPYNTETGYRASTTGNITGIYDMSGGSMEYVAAYMEEDLGISGFTSDPTLIYGDEYFDKYSSTSTWTSFNNKILGDATGELGPFYKYADGDKTTRIHNNWYTDHSHFTHPGTPWFHRGDAYNYGLLASQFTFVRGDGGAYDYIGFRLVLAE